MLDEICAKTVDWAVTAFGNWWAPWSIRFRRSAVGFRLTLIAEGTGRFTKRLFNQLKTAEDEGGFLQRLLEDPVEPVNMPGFRESMEKALDRMEAFFSGKAFAYLLFLMALSVCLLVAKGAQELAVLSAFFCVQWLAEAMLAEYEPICAGIRQRYLAAMMLRAGGYLLLLLSYFFSYALGGLRINVLLQGAIIVTCVMHLAMFVSFVAFNRRQQLFLRMISGVLGFAPALACAAGIALGASTAAREMTMALGGVVRACGIAMAFLAQQVDMIFSLGGGRLRYGRLWHAVLSIMGFFMMLVGAWLCAL